MAEIKSGAGADLLTVDAVSKAARTSLYDAAGNAAVLASGAQPAEAAGPMMMGLNDRSALPLRLDRLGSQALALHTPLMHDSFEGATTHALRWRIDNTTMAAAQTTIAGVVFNSGNITTINTGYMLSTVRRLMKTQRSPLQAKFRARLNHVNNSVMELGLGDASTFNGAHTAGAYWQLTSSGVLQPVVTYNGVDQTGTDIRGLVSNDSYYTFDVLMDDDEAIFVVQDSATGLILSRQRIGLPLTGQRLLSVTQLPLFARLYNTGVAPASAPQLILTDTYALALDADQNKPWAHTMATMGRGAAENPFTGAQLAAWANSAEPANATLSNTTVGYTTLGGKFQFAAVAGAATDYALFGFVVPSPSNLVITGVDIEAWNLGAAVATTPTLLTWALGLGSTAASLNTAGIVRVGVGAMDLPVAAAIGTRAQRLSKLFNSPLTVGAGLRLHVILRMPVGTATASQVIAGMVNFEGYFE
jgi:hypothetical protein